MFDRMALGSKSRISCCWSPSESVLCLKVKCASIWSCRRMGRWFLCAKLEADWIVSLCSTPKTSMVWEMECKSWINTNQHEILRALNYLAKTCPDIRHWGGVDLSKWKDKFAKRNVTLWSNHVRYCLRWAQAHTVLFFHTDLVTTHI